MSEHDFTGQQPDRTVTWSCAACQLNDILDRLEASTLARHEPGQRLPSPERPESAPGAAPQPADAPGTDPAWDGTEQ